MKMSPPARITLAPGLEICRIIMGMWQVSGEHGAVQRAEALDSMRAHVEAGFTTFDAADHYGPAEVLIGEYSADSGEPERAFEAFTKWVPEPQPMDRAEVVAAVERARRRMRCEVIDLMQFHWWDYADSRPLTGLRYLDALRREGRLRHLGLTNVDCAHLERIVDAGIEVVSNQVQYSIVDTRPGQRMVETCRARDVRLLAYGTLCGGFLADRYRGRPEPDLERLESASLRKYKKMIDAWGGWALFQELLDVLADIGRAHGATVSQVAMAHTLARPQVAGIIVGCRLGHSEYRAANAGALALTLTAENEARIAGVQARSRDLFTIIGDCGDEYRHGDWWGSR